MKLFHRKPRYVIEQALITEAIDQLSPPGRWPSETTLVGFFDEDLTCLAAHADLKTPDRITRKAPAGTRWAIAYARNDLLKLLTVMVVDSDRTRHVAIGTGWPDGGVTYRMGVDGDAIDDLFGNMSTVFA